MSGGRISGSLSGGELSEARIMQLALRNTAHVGASGLPTPRLPAVRLKEALGWTDAVQAV